MSEAGGNDYPPTEEGCDTFYELSHGERRNSTYCQLNCTGEDGCYFLDQRIPEDGYSDQPQ